MKVSVFTCLSPGDAAAACAAAGAVIDSAAVMLMIAAILRNPDFVLNI
jgi:hypothetical protein